MNHSDVSIAIDHKPLRIPPFYCPIEGARHPDAETIEQKCIEWLDAFGPYRTPAERKWLIGTFAADFSARAAPSADPEGVLLFSLWNYWAFAFDDVFCDEGEMSVDPGAFGAYAGRVQRTLEIACFSEARGYDTHVDADPYLATIFDIGRRTRELATPTQRARLIATHRRWLSGAHWQICNRAKGVVPSVDDYFSLRIGDAAGATTAWIEIANRVEVKAAEMDSPAVQALIEMAMFVAAIDNDMHSMSKEKNVGLADRSCVGVLAHHQNISTEQAIHQAMVIRDRTLLRFLELRERVRPGASVALDHYLDDLGHCIRGNIDWGMRVHRYLRHADRSSEHDPVYAEEELDWAENPLSNDKDPLPYPSIRWWWDDLRHGEQTWSRVPLF